MHSRWIAAKFCFAGILFFPGLLLFITGFMTETSLDYRVLAAGSMICGIALFYVGHSTLQRERKMSDFEIPLRSPDYGRAFHEIDGHVFVVFTNKDGKFVTERELPKGWTVQEYMAKMERN